MSLTRRSFVGLLGIVPVIGLFPGLNKPSRKAILMNRFSIAGFQYYDGHKILNRIKPGDRLNLLAEPENPHDEFAVEIYHGKTKLGYIPRSDNRHISRLLTHNVTLFSNVEYTIPGGPCWKAVKANVYFEA